MCWRAPEGRGWLERVAEGLAAWWITGCAATPPSAPPPSPSSSVAAVVELAEPVAAHEETAGPDSLEARLDVHAVTTESWVRRDLYTWTTPEQIEALRAGGPLLVATAATAGRATPFNRLLDEMVEQGRPGHELAAVLRDTPSLERRRYAWTSPFATVLGKGPRRYGEALIRVELEPHAVIARLRPDAEPPWSFRDGEGHEVPEAEILARPERIGAVYHLRVGAEQSIPFREYVLCNEAMVAHWSVGTPAIRERVREERRLVLDLAASPVAQASPQVLGWRAWPEWIATGPAPTPWSRWHRALAFDNERYRPGVEQLEAIAAALSDYDPTGPAIEGGQAAATSGHTSR